MNKAKAWFSAAIILVVAGASGVGWYLNDKGIIGKDDITQPDAYVEDYNEEAEGKDKENNDLPADDTPEAEDAEHDAHEEISESLSDVQINEFLSVFSRAYFSEDVSYDQSVVYTYELLRFAYSHINNNNPELVQTVTVEDDIRYYNSVPAEKVNEVLEEYLGVKVLFTSVYTDNDYAFFKYENGYFLTPAADGLPHTNIIVADSVSADREGYDVDFTVYSDGADCSMTSDQAKDAGTVYAYGKARIEKSDDGYKLTAYSIEW